MQSLLLLAVILVIVYLFAAIPWGLLIGRWNGIDIRQHGSGNIGATNVRRTLGKSWGRLCFFCDFMKGFLPVFVLHAMIVRGWINDPGQLTEALAALVCVAGHMWSIYIGFKGGKGISTMFGVMLALAPFSLLVAGAIWGAVFYASRYVSLASVAASAALPVVALVFSISGLQPLKLPVIVLLFVLGSLAIMKHRSNIKRLLAGTENRFDKKAGKE